MNLVDCTVTKVLSKPVFNNNFYGRKKWFINVEYDCYGRESETELMFDSWEEVKNVGVGYTFLG